MSKIPKQTRTFVIAGFVREKIKSNESFKIDELIEACERANPGCVTPSEEELKRNLKLYITDGQLQYDLRTDTYSPSVKSD